MKVRKNENPSRQFRFLVSRRFVGFVWECTSEAKRVDKSRTLQPALHMERKEDPGFMPAAISGSQEDPGDNTKLRQAIPRLGTGLLRQMQSREQVK